MLKIETQATPYVITLELNSQQLNDLFDQHWETIKDEVEIDGFRKGNVPKDVAEKQIGFEALYSKLIPNVYMEELQKENLDVVYSSEPKIYGSFNREGQIKLTTESFLSPSVKLGDFKSIKVKSDSCILLQDEIQQEIKNRKKKHSKLVEVQKTIENGDTITLDFEGFINNEEIQGAKAVNYKMIVGKTNMIPRFEEELIGLYPNEEKIFSVQFPENYHKKDLAGKIAIFKVKIHNVFSYELSQEDFLKLVCEGESYEQLVEKIKQELLDEKETKKRKDVASEALKQLVAISEVGPIPTPCIFQELDQKLEQFVSNSGKTLEELTTQFPNFEVMFENNNKDLIIEGIRSTLVLQELQKQFKITISEDEVQDVCVKRYGQKSEKNTTHYIVSESQLKIKRTLDKIVDLVLLQSTVNTL